MSFRPVFRLSIVMLALLAVPASERSAVAQTPALAAGVGAVRPMAGAVRQTPIETDRVPLAVAVSGSRDTRFVAAQIGSRQLSPNVEFSVDHVLATIGVQQRMQTFCPAFDHECQEAREPQTLRRTATTGPEWVKLQMSTQASDRLLPFLVEPTCYVVVWRVADDPKRTKVSYPLRLYGRVVRATPPCQ
jgi:hypothetical protein